MAKVHQSGGLLVYFTWFRDRLLDCTPLEVLIKKKKKGYEQRMFKLKVFHKLLHVHDFTTSTNLANWGQSQQ